MSQGTDREEDLEEALRLIVTVLGDVHIYAGIDREHAVLNIALDALGLDAAPPLHWRA